MVDRFQGPGVLQPLELPPLLLVFCEQYRRNKEIRAYIMRWQITASSATNHVVNLLVSGYVQVARRLVLQVPTVQC